ncbi:hypothetical protein A1O7_02458 [Cladophialophora yegresii CBS 114405]|uniref:Uncharacterized protein n=1 Tax=Cladophialophora yegresii CBS 114405 TaxID=1182544 RepID=W9WBS8_9EURO|nr:uncharacterized protein A1O7_02458 [Cladophialophora yegresii CBS 114405]EXJ62026.1 hypothetical protein A1O7_02458 [Cladophialophora yegresii CBS 114405]
MRTPKSECNCTILSTIGSWPKLHDVAVSTLARREVVRRDRSQISKGMPGSAPLDEVHEYVRMKANLNGTLTVHEYDSALLDWASAV